MVSYKGLYYEICILKGSLWLQFEEYCGCWRWRDKTRYQRTNVRDDEIWTQVMPGWRMIKIYLGSKMNRMWWWEKDETEGRVAEIFFLKETLEVDQVHWRMKRKLAFILAGGLQWNILSREAKVRPGSGVALFVPSVGVDIVLQCQVAASLIWTHFLWSRTRIKFTNCIYNKVL